ncbi:MAG: choice-of-anchor B family protein [Flavobacteriales bacterium]|nr:choice-of-anchor B family protein [Flavobacteriales bacterium]
MNCFGPTVIGLLLSIPLLAQTPCENGFAGPYPCHNVDLMSFMNLGQLGTVTSVADLWGWTDPLDGREYALVGTRTGTSFVDISVPTAPILVGTLPAHNNVSNLWRDVDVSGNWCFIGSEAAGHGLQVFDLTRLRNVTNPPATFTEDAHYAGFGNSHTIFADKGAPYVYAVGTGTYSGGLHVVNVSNPLAPTFAGAWSSDGYIHENNVILYNGPDLAHVGKRISLNFHINANDRVSFIDVSDPSDMSLIGNTSPYPGARLCHQGWVTPDHRYLLMNDEGDEGSPNNYNTRTHIFDIQDLEAPVYHGFFSGPNASYDHNLYIHQDLVWEANYTSGLHILDADLIPSGTLSLEAWFDTYTADNAKHYDGAWGNYPFFASGLVIVSDIDNGLFILRPRISLRLKAILEGPYDQSSGLMNDQLRVQGLIPLEEPFTAAGYVFEGDGGGESTNATVLAVSGPDAIVDWVLVELRDAVEPGTIVASRSALIQRDGDIVGMDGVSPIQFGVAVKDYHIGIRHRNHFGVVSAQALRVSVVEKSYDLSDGSIALFGTEATKDLGPIKALWAGNAMPDGVLKYTGLNNDRDVVLQAIGGAVPTNTVSGYRVEDLNLDGEVKYTGSENDRDIILQNIGGVVPTNIRVEQVP